jgi:hypothetical protein
LIFQQSEKTFFFVALFYCLDQDTYVAMDFNTAWSPIGVECMQAIVKKYNFIEMTYTYHDEGMDFSPNFIW